MKLTANKIFNFGTNDESLKQKLNVTSGNIEYSNDIKKFYDTIISFQTSTHQEINQGFLLQAITLKSAGEQFNLERLEFLGDSFLEYIATVTTCLQYPSKNKAKLHEIKISVVKNSFLYKMAEEKSISSYVYAIQYNKATWCPPNYITKTQSIIKIKYKAIADIVESLIGAFLLAKGHDAAVKIMIWLGLKKIQNNNNVKFIEENNTKNIEILSKFEKKINYKFKNIYLLKSALKLTRHQGSEVSYDALLHIGQAILQYLITRVLYDEHKEAGPGLLTNLRSKISNPAVYGFLSIKFSFIDYLTHEDVKNFMTSQEFKTIKVSLCIKSISFIVRKMYK